VAAGEPLEHGQTSGESLASLGVGEDSTVAWSVPSEIGDVTFPFSLRGYDRGAVDAYVSRVQHLVAELEQARAPEAAVKQALERVGEQTKGILERAGETAEQITVAAREDAKESIARAKGEADDIMANAKAEEAETLARSTAEAEATVTRAQKEAAEHLQRSREEIAALREQAEAQMRELEADTDIVRQERSQLLDDIREIATRVEKVAGSADARFPPSKTEQSDEGPQAGETGEEQGGETVEESGEAGEADATKVTAADEPAAEAGSRRRSRG
jgi:DivIVA domain-containing protein